MTPISTLYPNPKNPRLIKDDKFKKLCQSLKDLPKMMELRPIVVDENNVIQGGNMRLKALQELGYREIPDNWVKQAKDFSPDELKEFIIKDNIAFGEWNYEQLTNEWEAEKLNDWGLDIPPFENKTPHGNLQDTFIVPPFSILDSRQGYWRERKTYWHHLIGDKGESRQGALSHSELMTGINNGVSLLDPVLAEIIVKWFGLPQGNTIDCFAGDTIFGYVAATNGQTFTGIELRKEQADLNQERTKHLNCHYICDDGQNVLKHVAPDSQDLLFSCPPYFDLEVYSDLPNDASNQKDYPHFLELLNTAFTHTLKTLKQNRFAVIVVGDIRENAGERGYYGFPNHVKDIFIHNGLTLYNELILVEPLGTLPQRVSRFMKHRKIGKCHQNVLVFYKGHTKTIKNSYPNLTDYDEYHLEP